jgi:hypothetical protein
VAHPHFVCGHHLTGPRPGRRRYSAPSCVNGVKVRLAAAPLVWVKSPIRHQTCVRCPPAVNVNLATQSP